MMEKALNDMNRVEEYLIIWQQLWQKTSYKQPLYDKLDEIWKSMTIEEMTQVNKILHHKSRQC